MHINVVSHIYAWQKSSKMVENTKISVGSAFSLGATKAKQKNKKQKAGQKTCSKWLPLQ